MVGVEERRERSEKEKERRDEEEEGTADSFFFSEIARVLRPGGSVLIAASLGDATPFTTSEKDLKSGFSRHGIEPTGGGRAGAGTWFTATKAGRG